MNSLSLMIYAANVVDKVSWLIGSAGFACVIIGVIATIMNLVPWTEWTWDSEDKKKKDAALKVRLGVVGKRLLCAAFVGLLFASLIPSSRTIYMIAGSEAGEMIVTSPEAKEIFNDLKSIIKSKLKDELGEKK